MERMPPNAGTPRSTRDVSELLAAALGSSTAPGDCRVAGPTYVGSESRIFYAECAAATSPLAVKFFRDAREARSQFEALDRVAAAMAGGADFDVPRPYALSAAQGMLASEWIAGRSLQDELIDWHRWPGRAALGLRRAGVWLRRFHDAGKPDTIALDLGPALDRLADELDPCDPRTPGMARMRAAGILLERTAPGLAGAPAWASWLHGDFKPANVMLAGPRTVGIDFHAAFRDLVVRDQAHFLTHVELACYHPRGLRLWALRDRLVAAFLQGYGLDADIPSTGALSWMRLHSTVRAWANVATSDKGRLRKLYLMRCSERMAARLARRLAADLG